MRGRKIGADDADQARGSEERGRVAGVAGGAAQDLLAAILAGLDRVEGHRTDDEQGCLLCGVRIVMGTSATTNARRLATTASQRRSA